MSLAQFIKNKGGYDEGRVIVSTTTESVCNKPVITGLLYGRHGAGSMLSG